jgi:hypothetical protein
MFYVLVRLFILDSLKMTPSGIYWNVVCHVRFLVVLYIFLGYCNYL